MPSLPSDLHFDLGQPSLGLLATIGGIILIDIVLSGDNALVIGAAASRLPRGLRFLAILWGGVAAIVLRIVLAAAATLLLQVPLLQAAGGIVLMGIAIHLLVPQDDGPHIRARDRFLPAILTILAADVTMSLDNIIAIGALAKGDLTVLAIGLLFSMAALFLASAVISRLIERLSILLDLASLVLAYTAANLVAADPIAQPYVNRIGVGAISGDVVLHVVFVLVVLLADIALRVWQARRAPARPAPTIASGVPARVHTDDADLRNSAQRAAWRDDGTLNGSANGTIIGGNGATAERAREVVGSRPLASASETVESQPPAQ
jgi:YjbE family integral membrane protein